MINSKPKLGLCQKDVDVWSVFLIKVATRKKVEDKNVLWMWITMTMSQEVGERKEPPSSFNFVYFWKRTLEAMSSKPRSCRVSYQDNDPSAAIIHLPP